MAMAAGVRLPYMNGDDTLGWLVQAQRRNGLLQGDELAGAAATTVDIARHQRATLIAADEAGERIIGAAIALNPGECEPTDLTRRFDGEVLLLISGMIAGPAGLAQTAARLRSLGAGAVHVGVLGGWPKPIAGIDTIATLGTPFARFVSGSSAA